jgi:hypothetical protein
MVGQLLLARLVKLRLWNQNTLAKHPCGQSRELCRHHRQDLSPTSFETVERTATVATENKKRFVATADSASNRWPASDSWRSNCNPRTSRHG